MKERVASFRVSKGMKIAKITVLEENHHGIAHGFQPIVDVPIELSSIRTHTSRRSSFAPLVDGGSDPSVENVVRHRVVLSAETTSMTSSLQTRFPSTENRNVIWKRVTYSGSS